MSSASAKAYGDGPLLSVVVPVYNVQDFLPRCLDSLIHRSFRDYEVILVDDGSQDESGRICDAYVEKYGTSHHLSVIHQSNRGLSAARNAGLSKAVGQYVFFMDSDDYLRSDIDSHAPADNMDCLEKLGVLLRTHASDVFVLQAMIVDIDGHISPMMKEMAPGEYNHREFLTRVDKKKCFSPCAQYYICNRNYLEENHFRFYEGILHEDLLWTPGILMGTDKIFYTKLPAYYHVKRPGSIMNSANHGERARSLQIVFREMFRIPGGEMEQPEARVFLDAWVNSVMLVAEVKGALEENAPGIRKRYLYKYSHGRVRVKAVAYILSPTLYRWLLRLYRRVKGTGGGSHRHHGFINKKV